jgi:hypothetical protein
LAVTFATEQITTLKDRAVLATQRRKNYKLVIPLKLSLLTPTAEPKDAKNYYNYSRKKIPTYKKNKRPNPLTCVFVKISSILYFENYLLK